MAIASRGGLSRSDKLRQKGQNRPPVASSLVPHQTAIPLRTSDRSLAARVCGAKEVFHQAPAALQNVPRAQQAPTRTDLTKAPRRSQPQQSQRSNSSIDAPARK